MEKDKTKLFEKLETWEDADNILSLIADRERSVEKAQADMQKDIDAIKKSAEESLSTTVKELSELKIELEKYVENNKADFKKSKSKKLHFGVVGFRRSTSVIVPEDEKQIAKVISFLKRKKFKDCITSKPDTINKKNLQKVPKVILDKIGVEVVGKDSFYYKIEKSNVS